MATQRQNEPQLTRSQQWPLKRLPAGCVKVAPGVYTANFIPGDNVADSLADLKMAVRADPGLAVIRVGANAGLG
jgi:hypothetical protein